MSGGEKERLGWHSRRAALALQVINRCEMRWSHMHRVQGWMWVSWEKKPQTTKSLQETQAVWERSVQAERPEAKQSYISYLLENEGNFRVNWAADICPVLAKNTLLRRILSPAPCYPCWNLLPPHYWQPNSWWVPPWHIALINKTLIKLILPTEQSRQLVWDPKYHWKQEAYTYNGSEIIRYWFAYLEDIKSLTDNNFFFVYSQSI